MTLLGRIVNTEILTESQDYESMFNDLYRWNTVETMLRHWPEEMQDKDPTFLKAMLDDLNVKAKKFAGEQIAWAKKYLKRHDRIVWWLRFVKAVMFSNTGEVYAAGPDKNLYVKQPFFKKWLTLIGTYDLNFGITMGQLRNLEVGLPHWFSLPVPKIQNYEFKWQSPHQIWRDLEAFEEEWQEQIKNRIVYDESNFKEIIMTFEDGWCWVDLGRGSCQEEADAMGHCGNVPSERQGDTILSLRQIKQDAAGKYFEPHCTFILDKDGFLGEMKGRNNDKPVEKYHKYVVALLKTDLIKGMTGGGYEPEHNFSLGDLPQDVAEQLAKNKPNLMDLFSLQKFMWSESAILRASSRKKFINLLYSVGSFNNNVEVKDYLQDQIPFIRFNNAVEFVNSVGDSQTESALNSDFDDDYHDGGPGTVDEIPYRHYKNILKYVQKYLAEEYEEYCEKNDLEPDDADNAVQYVIQEQEPTVYSIFDNAHRAGYEESYQRAFNSDMRSVISSAAMFVDNGRSIDEPLFELTTYFEDKQWPDSHTTLNYHDTPFFVYIDFNKISKKDTALIENIVEESLEIWLQEQLSGSYHGNFSHSAYEQYWDDNIKELD